MSLSSERIAEEESFLEMRDRYAKGEIGLAQAVDSQYAKLYMDNNKREFEEFKKEAEEMEKAGLLHKKPVDYINHPPHYNFSDAKCQCGRRIECIDVTRHFNFNLGNAIKYLWRCEFKGNPLEDLKKALWYIQDEINKRT